MIKPQALKPGDTIGIMAPSSRVDEKNLQQAVSLLHALGYKTFIHPQTYEKLEQSAGTPAQKVAAMHELFNDRSIKAIFAAQGGNRAGYMLRDIDFDLIRDNPKIILGYSDITILLNAINKETGLVTFHGPVLEEFSGYRNESNIRQLFSLLGGQCPSIPMDKAQTVTTGTAEGPLIGGNLTLVANLLGSRWEPDFDDAILLLEDWDETCSYYDRLLMQLYNAGALDRIGGLVLGGYDFKDESENFIPFGFKFADIVEELAGKISKPVVMKAPFGHRDDLYTLPLGVPVRLEASRETKSLTLLEPAVL